MEVSSAIVEIERLREQIEKREEKITALTNGRLDVLKSALAQAMKFRKDREKEVSSEIDGAPLPF
jgi:AAA+ ATPase superfamily predicted ATPase